MVNNDSESEEDEPSNWQSPEHDTSCDISDILNTMPSASEQDVQSIIEEHQRSTDEEGEQQRGEQQQGGECQCCHRFLDITQEPIRLLRLNRNRRGLARKTFGDTAHLNNDSRVCNECHKYLHSGRSREKWSDCWAAAYYSMFATQGFLNLSENPERKLLTFIPDLAKVYVARTCCRH